MKRNILAFCISAVAFVAAFELSAQGLIRRPAQGPNRVAPDANETAGSATADAPADPKEAPALNWDAAPVDIVLQTYAEQTDKTVLKDPAAPTPTITLKTREGQKLTREEYLEAIEVVLEMNGIHLEPYGERFIRALPRKDVRKEGIPLIMDPETKLGETGRVVSMMIPFKNIGTDEAQKALEGFKSNSGILLVFERTNSILVTDTEQNINRMLEIAKSIDIATPVLENVFVRQIQNASAADIKQALEAIVQESQKQLEKDGKAANNASASSGASTLARPASRLLGGARGPGANQPQAPAPVNNESLVMSVSDADRGMIRGKVLILADDRSNKLVIVTQKPNMDFFDKVIEQLDVETTPDTVVKIYRLKYADAEDVQDMINDLIGNASSGKSSGKDNQNAAAKSGSGGNLTRSGTQATAQKKPANQRSGDAKAGELTKDNTTVLADKRINGLVVMTEKELVPTLESIIESMDVKLSQVLIETCIVEISLDDTLETGIDWVYQLSKSALDKNGNVIGGGQSIGGGGGETSAGTGLASVMTDGASSTVIPAAGSGIKYLGLSKKLNFGTVISASKNDSRSKYLASPIVMTVDNKEATIEATQSRQFLTGWSAVSSSYAGSGLPSPNYSAKDIGITLKITPKINPNGTVMLEVEEEYSQVTEKGQNILMPKDGSYTDTDVDVAVTRKMSADIILENSQSVVLGGLTEKTMTEKSKGIPFLKDIPWVGKWLFGYVSQKEIRKELLIFMTPYVLDDAESAMVEAARRKKVLSDSTPLDDGGWSASQLADPVSKKEQLRRIKEEAKKQDEERASRRAIEKWKLERVKALEKMDEEDRKLWMEQHKKELEMERQKSLEENMLDEKGQAALRQLADEMRARDLAEAEADAAPKKPEEAQ